MSKKKEDTNAEAPKVEAVVVKAEAEPSVNSFRVPNVKKSNAPWSAKPEMMMSMKPEKYIDAQGNEVNTFRGENKKTKQRMQEDAGFGGPMNMETILNKRYRK